ncbi:MAG: DinB family protein [Gemmatimonadota bacterium]|nr:MAG: DinB family protein [Gemmatimonadota bacterium]
MLSEWIRRVMSRDMASLGAQIEAYPDDDAVWKLAPGIANSAGTLALHLAGNIEAYVGAGLGGSGYVRDREAEFSTRDLSRADILSRVESARAALDAALAKLGDVDLKAEYPLEVAGVRLSTGQFLVHLAGHLAYHLGQVDYHRRALAGGASIAGVQSIPALTGGGG